MELLSTPSRVAHCPERCFSIVGPPALFPNSYLVSGLHWLRFPLKCLLDDLLGFTSINRRRLDCSTSWFRPTGGVSRRTLKINFKFEATSLRQQRLPKIAQPSESRWHIIDSEIVDADASFNFRPLDGS